MPNKDGTGNAWDALRNLGFALIYFLALYASDRYLGGKLIIMLIVGAAGGAALAKMTTKGSWIDLAAWGGFGLAAGFGFWLAL